MAQAYPEVPSDKIKGGAGSRPRSILKRQQESKKASGLQWDEMNIIATLHPEGKDYGHMKIDEPKTPYHQDSDGEGPADMETELSERAKHPGSFQYKEPPPSSMDLSSDSGDERPDPAEEKRTEEFQEKRRAHYNEGAFLKQAREMARRSLVEEDDK